MWFEIVWNCLKFICEFRFFSVGSFYFCLDSFSIQSSMFQNSSISNTQILNHETIPLKKNLNKKLPVNLAPIDSIFYIFIWIVETRASFCNGNPGVTTKEQRGIVRDSATGLVRSGKFVAPKKITPRQNFFKISPPLFSEGNNALLRIFLILSQKKSQKHDTFVIFII